VGLLKVICDGSLEEFADFNKSHDESFFASFGLNRSDLARSVKLLALCSLAAQAEDKILSYQTIKDKLNISENEVESLVVEAITENVLVASIDQLKSTVTIR
jgi:hypothetical protein